MGEIFTKIQIEKHQQTKTAKEEEAEESLHAIPTSTTGEQGMCCFGLL